MARWAMRLQYFDRQSCKHVSTDAVSFTDCSDTQSPFMTSLLNLKDTLRARLVQEAYALALKLRKKK